MTTHIKTHTNFEIIKPQPAKRRPLVLHIPHSATYIPPEVLADFVLNDADLQAELLAMTDHHVDTLMAPLNEDGATAFVNRVSRLVMDPERFADDADESMAERHGLGAVYLRTSDGRPLRRPDFTAGDRETIMRDYYRPYAQAFEALVTETLERFGACWILDCHSYPSRPLPFEDPALARPEICVGFEEFHKPPAWLEAMRAAADGLGLGIGENVPFAGSYVPMKYYRKDARVRSMMLEVRRDLYMDEATGAKFPDAPLERIIRPAIRRCRP